MVSRSRRNISVIIFTGLIIFLVNIAWWFYYAQTEKSFENQLSRRLATAASLGASIFHPELISSLADGSLEAYYLTLEILSNIRAADEFSEVFIITADYEYLASTLSDPDSLYYLATINGDYIDSAIIYAEQNQAIVTPGYTAGNIVLKSVFLPLADSTGAVTAVLGIEADIDYTAVLADLRRNLYLSSTLSILAGVIFGLFFFMIQRRISTAEKSLFMAQSQAGLGRMVAVVSHEIKNPLMIIRASAERLLKNNPESREASFVIEETDRLNKILSEYLNFASGKIALNIQKVELNSLAAEIGEKFIPRLARENVNLTYWQIEKEIFVRADEPALRQVIINLIMNAADAVKGRDNAQVELVCRKINTQSVIEILDNGPGFSPKEARHIFEPFYTTKTSGSGLGLYLSKTLVEAMQGRIEGGKSDDGRTSFKVWLHPADESNK